MRWINKWTNDKYEFKEGLQSLCTATKPRIEENPKERQPVPANRPWPREHLSQCLAKHEGSDVPGPLQQQGRFVEGLSRRRAGPHQVGEGDGLENKRIKTWSLAGNLVNDAEKNYVTAGENEEFPKNLDSEYSAVRVSRIPGGSPPDLWPQERD